MPADIVYFPFDAGTGSYSREDRWGLMMKWMRTTGILATTDPLSSMYDCFVSPGTGLEIQVAIGEAWVQGFYFGHTGDPFYMDVEPNISGMTRDDLVTIRCNFQDNTIAYNIIVGSLTPVQNSIMWDLPIAELAVPDGATTITSMDITDLRVRSMQGDGGSSAVTLASAGGSETLVADGVGPGLEILGLTAGTDITLTPSGTDITIASTAGAGVTLTNAGSGSTLVNDGTGPSLATKGIVAGKNTLITTSSTDITLNSVGTITSSTINMNTSIDPNVYRLFNLTVEADLTVTITDFDSSTTTSKASVYLIQDGTGGHTITFAGNVEFPGGIQPPNTEDPSSRDLFEFEWNGTDWMLVNNTSDYS